MFTVDDELMNDSTDLVRNSLRRPLSPKAQTLEAMRKSVRNALFQPPLSKTRT